MSVEDFPLLTKNLGQTIHKEWQVCHSSYLCSETFHLRVSLGHFVA